MKKIIYIIMGLVILPFISFPDQSTNKTIRVTKPVNGEVWQKNTPHLVEWTSTGNIHEFVKIRLYNVNGSTKIKNITNRTSTINSSFRCPSNIFNDVRDGIYVIRVKTLDNNVFDDSGLFTIGNPPTVDHTVDEAVSPPDDRNNSTPLFRLPRKNIPGINKNVLKVLNSSIKITFPPKDHNWRLKLGNQSLPFPIYIMWEKTGVGPQDDSVKIILKRVVHGVKNYILTQGTRNKGLYNGEISRGLKTSLYTIIIETLDKKIRVESDTFYITNADNDPD